MKRLMILLFVALMAAPAHAAPEPDLWPRWQAHDATSTAVVDHAAWDRLLKIYLSTHNDGLNRFAYGKVTAADRRALEDYVAMLAATEVSTLNRGEQFAYWLNLYNALTVAVILRHYPVDSILDIDISPGLFSNGPWGKKLLTVEGEDVSLDDIEHRILRPIWRDPRIHYGVNCASIGCPNLWPSAFTAATLDADLNAAAVDYINTPRGVRIDGNSLVVSKIYDWFDEDFEGTKDGVKAHLAKYAKPPLAKALADGASITGYAYDWALNE